MISAGNSSALNFHQSLVGMSTHTWASIAQSSTAAAASKKTPSHPFSVQSQQSRNQPNQYRRREAHQPRTAAQDEEQVYVLTLLTDAKLHHEMTALRRKWFPEKLLKVDAHITLFHALPGSRLDEIKRGLAETAARTERFELKAGPQGVFRMGKGVGIEIDTGSLARTRCLREGLRSQWNGEVGEAQDEGWLSEQDARKGWKGHYTVMNKEDDRDRMEQCYRGLTGEWHGGKGLVNGLRLWRYDRGWWRKTEDFFFGDGQRSAGRRDNAGQGPSLIESK